MGKRNLGVGQGAGSVRNAELKTAKREFPGSPVVRLHIHCRGHEFDPWWGNQDLASCMAKKKRKRFQDSEGGESTRRVDLL